MTTLQGNAISTTRPTVSAKRRAELNRVLSDEQRGKYIERVQRKTKKQAAATEPDYTYITTEPQPMPDFSKAEYDEEKDLPRAPQWAWGILITLAFVFVAWGTAQAGMLVAFAVALGGGVMAVIHVPIRKFIRG
jgi:hypothetical protein